MHNDRCLQYVAFHLQANSQALQEQEQQIVLKYSCKFQNVFIRVVEAMPHIRGKKQRKWNTKRKLRLIISIKSL